MARNTKPRFPKQKAKGRKRPRGWHRKGRPLEVVGEEIRVEVRA